MAFTSAQLATEITTDPKSLGYGASATSSYAAIAAKLNATYAGVGIVWRTDLSASEIVGCLVWSDLSAATVTQWTALQTLLIPAKIDASNANVRALFAGLFASAATTLANLTAAAKKASPSRAEELWGYGTVISDNDIGHALGNI